MKEPEPKKTNCYHCGGGHVEVYHVSLTPGYDNYGATDVVRGDVASLHFKCEDCDKTFDVNYGFHKGRTLRWEE